MASSDNKEPFETIEFSKVRGLAERFEQAWASQNDSSKGIDLLPFLPEPGDPARLAALYELIKTDLACRWQRGLPTSLEAYIEKFPELGSLEKLPPKLIYEEYRVRARHGSPAPLNQYKSRFPNQFAELESLIQTEPSHTGEVTAVSKPDFEINVPSDSQSPLAMVGNGTIVGGHYALNKRIGTGGFGEVWLGNDIHGNIPKAIKIITRSIESDEAKQEYNALEIIKRLNHPYLLRTEGFFAEQERLIVVMELADGSLRELLRKTKKENDRGIPVDKLLGYLRHAAEGLDYLHEEGIFHRDIKPENILLVGKIAKVADFGLARLAANRQSTKTNFAGTSAYSAPETWKGRVTAKSDHYSLAVTYAELRLGRSVFKGNTIYEFMVEHLQSQPNLDPIPEAEQQVILRGLAKEPSDRYATCSEFVAELQRAISDLGSLPATGPRPQSATSVGGGQTVGSRTPETKWTTPVVPERPPSNASVSLHTQRGGNPTATNKPPTWKLPSSHIDLEVLEPELAQPLRRSRRRKRANPLVAGVVFALIGAMILWGVSLIARSNVYAEAKELASKREFKEARGAIENAGVFVSPYRENLKADLLKHCLFLAEEAHSSGSLDDVVEISVKLYDAFLPDKDEFDAASDFFNKKMPDLLKNTFNEKLPKLVNRGQFKEAYQALSRVKFSVNGKAEMQQWVSSEWLKVAWEDVKNEDYAKAKRTAGELIAIDAGEIKAKVVFDLASAAESLEKDIRLARFREVIDRLPRFVPDEGASLRKTIQEKIRAAWIKHSQDYYDAKNFDKAQDMLFEFNRYFKNDQAGDKLLKETHQKVFDDLYDKKKFEDVLNLLKKTDFRFKELLDDLKHRWRDFEIAKYEKGDDSEKKDALQGLQKLSSQFVVDIELQDAYETHRGKYVKTALEKIEQSLAGKSYFQAREQIEQTKLFAKGAQVGALNLLSLRALLEDPTTTEGDHPRIQGLLREVMKQKPSEMDLRPVIDSIVQISANERFAKGIELELRELRDLFEDRAPKDLAKLVGEYKKLPGIDSANGRILDIADSQFRGDHFDKALGSLRQMDAKKETDKNVMRKYYVLYGKLGERVALKRDEIGALKKAAVAQPDLSVNIAKVMTQSIKSAWKTAPDNPETWESRIEDADQADRNQPIVLAYKAEALLELERPVDFDLLPGEADEKLYIDYVRAFAALKKKDGVRTAAQTLHRIPPSEAWLTLVPNRRKRACQILETAAVELAKSPDGPHRLFESAEEATRAFQWIDKSLKLSNKSWKDATTLEPAPELAFALAAACKVPPAFDVNKFLGDDLFAKPDTMIASADRTKLVLSNPNAFPNELKSLKDEKRIHEIDIDAALAVGDSQLRAAAENSELVPRQAFLFALKGWALEQSEKKNKDYEAIHDAYDKAYNLEKGNKGYLLAKARFGAIAALKSAEHKKSPASKINYFEQGIKACDPALKKEFADEESWADLCLLRSQLALELGNALVNASVSAGQSKAFRDARDFAIWARDAKIPHKKPADILLALGNSYEDLAFFVHEDVEQNYRLATETLDEAGKKNFGYHYNAGRARFRWATDRESNLNKKKKDDLLEKALGNLSTASVNPGSPNAPEANYFEGNAYWFLGKHAEAIKSYERCVIAAQKNEDAHEWARFSIDFAVQVAREQKANADRSLKWIEGIDKAYQPLKETPALEGSGQLLNNVAAEMLMALADSSYKAKGFAKYKMYVDRALPLNHSVKGHEFAADRAIGLKTNAKKLDLKAADLDAIYNQTLKAIAAVTELSDDQKQNWTAQFEKLWKKIP